MNTIIPNRVVLWGNDNANLLGVVRQLYDFKVKTFIVFNLATARIVNKSKCCKDYYVAKNLDDGLQFLQSNFSGDEEKPILLSTGDVFARIISNNYNKLSTIFIIPGINNEGILANLLDKNNQTIIASQVGLNFPYSIKFTKTTNENFDIEEIPIPCIIKPTKIASNNKKDFKIKVCHNKEDLTKTIDGLSADNEYIIQEYINIDNLVVVDGCRLQNGETIIHGCLICEHGGEDGDSSFGKMTSNIPSCINLEQIKAFVNKINYYGPFGFDFGVSNNDSYFFEINLRIDATNYLFYKIGAPYIVIWLFDRLGYDYTDFYCQNTVSKIFIDDIGELFAIREGKTTLSQWFRNFNKAKIRKYFSCTDIFPFLYQFAIFWVYPIYKLFKRCK